MRTRKSSSSRACRPRPGRGRRRRRGRWPGPWRWVGPVLGGHGLGRGREPGQLGRLHPDEEAAPAEHRVLASQRHQASGEGQQLVVGLGPVEPGDGVVLAVGVVVATHLGAAELVAAAQQQHRTTAAGWSAAPGTAGRGAPPPRGRRWDPPPRSSRTGCRRSRPGWPRRWPRCAWRHRTPGPAG